MNNPFTLEFFLHEKDKMYSGTTLIHMYYYDLIINKVYIKF